VGLGCILYFLNYCFLLYRIKLHQEDKQNDAIRGYITRYKPLKDMSGKIVAGIKIEG